MVLLDSTKSNIAGIAAIALLNDLSKAGDSIYFYITVRSENFDDFNRAQEEELSFTPTEFGDVIASGIGDPSKDVTDYINNKYRC